MKQNIQNELRKSTWFASVPKGYQIDYLFSPFRVWPQY